MKLLIAHRGLVEGPDLSLENNPKQIIEAVSLGYECEIDLWLLNNQLYLGHDEPTYPIKDNFLETTKFWIHAKNLPALYWLTNTDLKYFWHQEDDFVLTSNGYLWTYPGKNLTDKSICVMPEQFIDLEQCSNLQCYGICSDYVKKIQNFL